MNNLPIETFSHVFSFLDVVTCIRNKAVCKSWSYDASKHCGYLHIKLRSIESLYNERGALEAELKVEAQEVSGEEYFNVINSQKRNPNDVIKECIKRTKGHLPDPNVLAGGSKILTFQSRCSNAPLEASNAPPEASNAQPKASIDHFRTGIRNREIEIVQSSSSQIAVAIRFEQMYKNWQMSCISSLNFESLRMQYRTKMRFSSKSILLKKSIQVLDLSSLCQLKRVSVRGCSSLTTLRLPQCLEALDASACTKLEQIGFSSARNATNKLRLEALNLNGCRSLTLFELFKNAVENVQELDMTSVTKMSTTLISTGLKGCICLKNISLRYIAIDEYIFALAVSSSANCLNLIDIAFSQVTDSSVECLVNRALKLERCNLRGNQGISGRCYNQVPIHLSRRNIGDNDVHSFSVGNEESGPDQKRRKGDNIFFFVND